MKTHILFYVLLFAGSSFAQTERQQLFKQDIAKLNELVAKRVVGRTTDFIIQDDFALYADQSQYLLYADFKAHTRSSIRLTDSFLYAQVFTREQVAEIDIAIEQHKDKLSLDKQPGHETTQLYSFAYYQGHIYLLYSLMNFYGMKQQNIIVKKNGQSVSFRQKYLVELNVVCQVKAGCS